MSPLTDFFTTGLWKTLLALGLLLYLILIPFSNTQNPQLRWATPSSSSASSSSSLLSEPTSLKHIAFGMMGSVAEWPHRRIYMEAWWRPNKTHGYIFLDRAPPPELLPWPQTAPPYRVVDNLSRLYEIRKPRKEVTPRMVHGIFELYREVKGDLRWIVMGDDDTVCFVDNIVDVLAGYDHNKYYYLGGHSESVISNHWFSFDQAFGGGGIVLSYALARALVEDMDKCLIRYADSRSADLLTKDCIADIGVNLTPHKGNHQVDLHGDFSGYLSAHPKVPVMTFHHFHGMFPIFPGKDRNQSTRHLMKAADVDQSRLLQQTICYHRQSNWSFSVSWGYSAQIYERIMPRSYLQMPIETFLPWANGTEPPFYMFNTRPLLNDSCETPHSFFLESVNETVSPHQFVTTYSRSGPRGLPSCSSAGNHPADSISRIRVFSPPQKRLQIDRCECCDVVRVGDGRADIQFRECKIDEIIA